MKEVPEMVKRAARSICGAATGDPRIEAVDGVANLFTEDHWLAIGAAAIGALREPTDAMLDACRPPNETLRGHWRDYAADDWRRMIDAAQK